VKTRNKVIAGGAFAIIVAAISVIVGCPQFAATRNSYFDANNGRLKIQWVCFGRVYRESIEETEYSKLLKELGFEEQPAEWKPANTEELGIRRWFLPQHVSYTHGGIAADAYVFTRWAKSGEIGQVNVHQETAKFRNLIQKGDLGEVEQYVTKLQVNAASK
jgi:hypothetical protein